MNINVAPEKKNLRSNTKLHSLFTVGCCTHVFVVVVVITSTITITLVGQTLNDLSGQYSADK